MARRSRGVEQSAYLEDDVEDEYDEEEVDSSDRFNDESGSDAENNKMGSGLARKLSRSGGHGSTASENKNAGNQKSILKKKKIPEKNELFKDMEETGRWGEISRREVIGISVVVILIVIAVIVTVVVLVSRDSSSTPPPPPRATPAPSFSPTPLAPSSPQERLSQILLSMSPYPFLDESEALLTGKPVSFFIGKADDASADPLIRAAGWIMLDDPAQVNVKSGWVLPRFVLALLYFSMGGDNWTNDENWLTGESICSWYGVSCDRFNEVLQELDLSNNNLTDELPDEIVLLRDIRSLFLRQNNISGAVPSEALGNIPSLSVLYMNDNALTGSIDASLMASGTLTTLYLQRNNLAGLVATPFCPLLPDGPLVLDNMGFDCSLDPSRQAKVFCTCCGRYKYSPCFS